MRGATDETYQRFRAEYYAMITCLDAQIGRIIKALEERGQLDNTIIIFTGDQGSMLGDLGLWGKGVFYKGSINSPLVIAGPGSFVKNVKVDRPVELLDVAPTLLELAHASEADRKRCHGHSLLPLLTGQGEYPRKYAFAEEKATQMVVDERYKLVRDPEKLLVFDLAEDPNELKNLAGQLPEVEARLTKAIDDWFASTPPRRDENPVPGRKPVEKK
jgi:arylsulfatase A-like enzyme